MPAPAYEFMMRLRPVTAAVAGLIFLGACAGDTTTSVSPDEGANSSVTSSTTSAGTGGEGVEGDTVTISNFAYEPPTLIVASGSEVTVTNNDEAAHTLTAKDMAFDTGNLAKGQSAKVKVEGSGEIEYFCTIHEYMTGLIRVKN